MVLRTLSYAIAAWYAMLDVRCSLFKTRCTVNGTRSMIPHDTPSMIAHDTPSMTAHGTPFAFKTARCAVFKRNWGTLVGIFGQCCSHLRKNATQPEKYANWSKRQSLWLVCFTTIISWVRRDESSLKSFDVQTLVLPRATFLVSNGNNIVARNFACFAAIDVNPDKSPLETEPVARDNIKIWTWKLFNELSSRLTQLITVVWTTQAWLCLKVGSLKPL